MPPEEDRATTIGDMHKKFDEVESYSSQVMQAARQTEYSTQ